MERLGSIESHDEIRAPQPSGCTVYFWKKDLVQSNRSAAKASYFVARCLCGGRSHSMLCPRSSHPNGMDFLIGCAIRSSMLIIRFFCVTCFGTEYLVDVIGLRFGRATKPKKAMRTA